MQITGKRHPFVVIIVILCFGNKQKHWKYLNQKKKKGKYKVGFDENGVVQAVDVDLINNGGNNWIDFNLCETFYKHNKLLKKGYSFDLSGPVVDRAIFHSDNAYFMKNARN